MDTTTTTTHGAAGGDVATTDAVLEQGAALTQPLAGICAHLNAFHVYAADPQRCVEANHYCAHISDDVRQCLIYDAPAPAARLIGIEYMVSPRVYATLPADERALWHSHVFEVKSGMLVMPTPSMLPQSAWEIAETKEMERVIHLYGKTYHLWQVDRGDVVPLGAPQLMMSVTSDHNAGPVKDMWKARDERFGVDSKDKAARRSHIPEPEVHPDADSMWKKK